MTTVDENNVDDRPSIVKEHSPNVKPKRQRTLRRDLSDDGPREFRHISRLNSEVSPSSHEIQRSSDEPDYDTHLTEDLNQYFSGLNKPHSNSSIKPPKVRLTRPLTKGDITYPINFRHIAHLNYHEISKKLDNMADFAHTAYSNSASTENEFSLNARGVPNLTKEDISEPNDFRHIAHVGFEDNELKMNTESTTMKFSLEKAGPSCRQENNVKRSLTDIITISSPKNKENESQNPQRKLIKKKDIGYPENFQHLVHIDLQNEYELEKIYDKANLDNVDIKDREIQKFISEITDEHPEPPVNKPIPKPRLIKKRDIEHPQNFRHNAHISCSKDKPSVDRNDVLLKNFFKKAGVTEEHLMNDETREFIFDFVRQYSKFGDGKNDQHRPIPSTYRNLAEKLLIETEKKSQEEYLELLLAMYGRNNPIPN